MVVSIERQLFRKKVYDRAELLTTIIFFIVNCHFPGAQAFVDSSSRNTDMRKVVLAFDGINFSRGAFEFARRMNQQAKILVTGVFLPQIDYANIWSYPGAAMSPAYIPLVENEDRAAIEENIAEFELLCQRNAMEYRIHRDLTEFALAALATETRFGDLLILGGEYFYQNLGISEPNESLKSILHDAESPVLVVPEDLEFPGSNVLAYDGSDDSVFAIKQFAYLLPELCENKTLLVYAKEHAVEKLPEEALIAELAARHFPDLTLSKVQINPKKFFETWMVSRKGPILISGAFNRSLFSLMFRKSFVSDVIRDHKIPVFIAHR